MHSVTNKYCDLVNKILITAITFNLYILNNCTIYNNSGAISNDTRLTLVIELFLS